MRIVYLNPSGRWGGAETSLRGLLASVRDAEPEWELWLVLGEDGPLADHAREIGVKVIVLAFPPALARLGDARSHVWATLASMLKAVWATAVYSRRLTRTIQPLAPDIIHSNGFKMHLLGAWSRPRRTPLIWHIHDYVGARPIMSRLLRPFTRACTLAVANSKSVARDVRELMPDLKVMTVYNAVDMDRFSPAGKQVDLDAISNLAPAARSTVRVGLVAAFARWKGQKVFLRALSVLSATTPVRGYIIGAPIYQTEGSQWSVLELKQECERLGLTGKVGFPGFIDENASAMRSLDVIVHASTQPEPFGMVIIEAMACGKAVIASQTGGASELFIDGENALGHQPGDANALAQQITRLACDERLRAKLGEAGRSTAVRLYGTSRLAQEMVAVYRSIGGGRVRIETEPMPRFSTTSE